MDRNIAEQTWTQAEVTALETARPQAEVGDSRSVLAELEARLDLTQRYLALVDEPSYIYRHSGSSQQDERDFAITANLRNAAAAGFRVRAGIIEEPYRLVVLEKLEPGEPYEYTMIPFVTEDRLNEWGTKGFCALPSTLRGSGVMMEKAPGTNRSYNYRLLAAPPAPANTAFGAVQQLLLWEKEAESSLMKDLRKATREGYQVVGLVPGPAILLQETPPPEAESSRESSAIPIPGHIILCTSLVLNSGEGSTAEEDLLHAVRDGYRLVAASRTQVSAANLLCFLLERPLSSAEKPKYLYLSGDDRSTLEEKLNDGARRGYRLCPNAMWAVPMITKVIGSDTSGSTEGYYPAIVAVMEESGSPQTQYGYRVLAVDREELLLKELREAAEGGYDFAAMTSNKRMYGSENIVVVEKKRSF